MRLHKRGTVLPRLKSHRLVYSAFRSVCYTCRFPDIECGGYGMPIKPTLFVGSSSEALVVARQFAASLQDVTHAIVWKDAPEFEPMRSTLEGLLNIAERYDFGVFIFTPDDEITSRGAKGKVARDNVILELGVFLGSLGPDRAFAVVEEGSTVKQKLKAISVWHYSPEVCKIAARCVDCFRC